MHLDDLLHAAREWIQHQFPGMAVEELTLHLNTGRRIRLPVPMVRDVVKPRQPEEDLAAPLPFVPSPFQKGILAALDGVAMRTDQLGAAVGDRGRLFRKPGGIQELKEHGLVANHPRLGYFRPDSPPEELEEDG